MSKVKGLWGAALLAIALVVSCLAVGLVSCSSGGGGENVVSDIGKGQTLRVGVRDNISGFGYYYDKSGTYKGLEIDIAEDLAQRLSYNDVELTTVTANDRDKMLSDDKVDCVIACYSITDSAKENFDFSPAYYNDQSVFMVEDSSLFDDIEDLKYATFGTVAGSNATSQLVSTLKDKGLTNGKVKHANKDKTKLDYDNFQVVEMETHHDLSDALEAGEIDAVVMDQCLASTYLWEDRHFIDFTVSTQDYGVATKKGSDLSKPISEAIQSMLDDGTIEALIDKWD